MTSESVQVLGIAGSLRQGSFNRGLIRAAQALAPDGMAVQSFDLKGIPLYDGDLEEQGDPPEVQALKSAIRGTDALLLATPEYNAGIPAPLKNAIDWASRSPQGYRESVLYGKPVAIMGGAGRGAVRAQEQLIQVLGVLGVDVVQPQVSVAQVWDKFDQSGQLTHEPTREEIRALLESVFAALSGTWITCMQWRPQATAG